MYPHHTNIHASAQIHTSTRMNPYHTNIHTSIHPSIPPTGNDHDVSHDIGAAADDEHRPVAA